MDKEKKRLAVFAGLGVCAALVLAVSSGCARQHDARRVDRVRPISEAEVNRHIINSHFDEQAHAGILATRTLHPHHFHANLAALNLLGERQINILAANTDARPLRLHISGAEVDGELHEARVAAVRERLSLAGIEQVEFLDAPPTVRSMSSDRAIRSMQRPAAAGQRTETNGGTGTGTRSSR